MSLFAQVETTNQPFIHSFYCTLVVSTYGSEPTNHHAHFITTRPGAITFITTPVSKLRLICSSSGRPFSKELKSVESVSQSVVSCCVALHCMVAMLVSSSRLKGIVAKPLILNELPTTRNSSPNNIAANPHCE